MRKNDGALTRDEQNLLEDLERMAEEDIDTTDIPEVLEVRNPRRGAYYQRPQRGITILLDEDIVEWLESLPTGQADLSSCVHNILRAHIAQETGDPTKQR